MYDTILLRRIKTIITRFQVQDYPFAMGILNKTIADMDSHCTNLDVDCFEYIKEKLSFAFILLACDATGFVLQEVLDAKKALLKHVMATGLLNNRLFRENSSPDSIGVFYTLPNDILRIICKKL